MFDQVTSKMGDLRGNDIGSGSVCFDFPTTNVVQLTMLSKYLRSPYNHGQQPVIEPEPMSLPLNHLP